MSVWIWEWVGLMFFAYLGLAGVFLLIPEIIDLLRRDRGGN